jgi:hypothetical protein
MQSMQAHDCPRPVMLAISLTCHTLWPLHWYDSWLCPPRPSGQSHYPSHGRLWQSQEWSSLHASFPEVKILLVIIKLLVPCKENTARINQDCDNEILILYFWSIHDQKADAHYLIWIKCHPFRHKECISVQHTISINQLKTLSCREA